MPMYSIYGLYIGMYDPRVLTIWLISTMKNEKNFNFILYIYQSFRSYSQVKFSRSANPYLICVND